MTAAAVDQAAEILASQYEELQPGFASYRTSLISLIEKENVRDVLAPVIGGARVLEIACGSGFYTFDLLSWGATSVLAVDLSPEMISAAKERKIKENVENVEFRIADVTEPVIHSEEKFDVVFGAWPLEYARDYATLVSMCKNVSLNLRDGGTFVCVTRVPTDDPRGLNEKTNQVRPGGGGKVLIENLEETEHGVLVRLYGTDGSHVGVSFVCLHWKKDVYESAARAGGLTGDLSWTLTRVPERYLQADADLGEATPDEVKSYVSVPEYGILKVQKE